MKITAYANKMSAAPGETIDFMVNCENKSFDVEFVKLICGDLNPEGPGYKEKVVKSRTSGKYKGRQQKIHAGSYAKIDSSSHFNALRSFSAQAFIWPTTPEKGAQTILGNWSPKTNSGFNFGVAEKNQGVALEIGLSRKKVFKLQTKAPLLSNQWYFITVSYDSETRIASIRQEPLHSHTGTKDKANISRKVTGTVSLNTNDAPLTIGALYTSEDKKRLVCHQHFNGKIDSPAICHSPISSSQEEALKRLEPDQVKIESLIARWDFSTDIQGTAVTDRSANRLDGNVVNMPTRAMTGWNWTGDELNWKNAQDQYGAIHFHDDDVHDAGWEVDFTLTVPKSFRSGLYAARLRCGSSLQEEDYVPFAILPPRGRATAKICFLLPTASYMAYANEHMGTDVPVAQLLGGRLVEHERQDLYRNEHREYGASCYDHHSDGSGVAYSSRLRPILNMRPKYRSWLGGSGSSLWQFNADTHITNWLEAMNYDYDVITDEELHYEGLKSIEKYKVVLSSSHPEYHSKDMWDAMMAYQQKGGRLMYLGANGWYWRIAFHESEPGIIEVRRNEGGIRGWEPKTGEYYHAFTGEYGGLWRRNGRPPQKIVGTGFTAQGFDISSYYERKPDSHREEVAWIMKGVGKTEKIGDFGLIGGGAAGLELDRVDVGLGTPPSTYLLASSVNHTDIYLVVNEEILINYPGLGGQENPLVRADMAFFPTQNNGGVFSTSSIAWAGSLSHNNYKNNVSRITKNVLDRFISNKKLLDDTF